MSEAVYSDSAEALVHEYVRTKNADLRDVIVRNYATLVERVARRYSGLEPYEDLVQVGFMGLLNALNMFEPSKGVRFNTYATHLVAGSIKHHLRDRTKIIRESAWLQEVRHKVNRVSAQLRQDLGRSPSEGEIASQADVTPELLREVMSTEELFRVSSLTAGVGSDEEGDSDEMDMADDGGGELLHLEERLVLERAMAQLRDLEQRVLLLFHFESLNQTEIAAKLGISGNYVSHILRQSLSKLRTILGVEEKNDSVLRRQASNLSHDVMDEITDAYTEGYLIGRLDEECARAACENTAVAFVHVHFQGLDRLRQFYGIQAVEDFLRDAASFLRGGVRRLDTVGRLGDTGFGVILPGTDERVGMVYERLVERIQIWLSQESVARGGVAVLLGHSVYPGSGRSAKKLLAAAKLLPIQGKRAA